MRKSSWASNDSLVEELEESPLSHETPIINLGIQSKVVDSVLFRSKWTENLVPVCKPVCGNPPFHLGLNFGVFRVILGVSVSFESFRPVWVCRPVYFLGDFYFLFFSLSSRLFSSLRLQQPPASPHSSGQLATSASRLQPSAPHSNGPASLSTLSSLPPHSSKASDFPHISDQLIKKIY